MKLATPGAILMFAGIVILWWGLGIVRGEVSGVGGSVTKHISGSFPKPSGSQSGGKHSGGAGGQQLR